MKPNILLILTDQQRWDSLACYGNRFVSSPNADRLAADGARFEACFTPWPVCTPARASLWTGVHPHEHGVTQNVYGIESAIRDQSRQKTTVFDLMRSGGYTTAYFGKWHLGESDPGFFDVWDGFNSSGGHWLDGERDGVYKPDVQTDRCIGFLRDHAGSDRPFFMVQAYYPPHTPFTAPKRFLEPYRGIGLPRPGYYAGVTAIDHDVGRILAALDELGLADDTVVVFCSDHGETFKYRTGDMEHHTGGLHKFSCHDEAIRVPLIVRWPHRVRPGATPACFVGLEDLMPTILECAGLDLPSHLRGRSLVPWFDGAVADWREAYYVENVTQFGRAQQRCLRTDQWKLILSDDGRDSLFDLEEDPEEEFDLYRTPHELVEDMWFPGFPDVIASLARRLMEYAERIGDDFGVQLARRRLDELHRRDGDAGIGSSR